MNAFKVNSGSRVGFDAKSKTRFPVREQKPADSPPVLEAEVVSNEPESNSYAQYADTAPQQSTAAVAPVETAVDKPQGLLALLVPKTQADWMKLALGIALAWAAKQLFGGKN